MTIDFRFLIVTKGIFHTIGKNFILLEKNFILLEKNPIVKFYTIWKFFSIGSCAIEKKIYTIGFENPIVYDTIDF